MFAFRGRGGPRQSTPANVQCQKCLKRDKYFSLMMHGLKANRNPRHYSYECKGSAQDRPYVSRPSRSQQLRNPKLVPKLTEDTPNALENKKGVADEEIAKQEAERKRKRELEERDDKLFGSAPSPKRHRSPSVDSVSTISTDAGDAPRRRRDSRSPRRRRSVSSDGEVRSDRSMSPQSRGGDGDEDMPSRRNRSPVRRRHRSSSVDSRSHSGERREQPYHSRDVSPPSRDEGHERESRNRRFSNVSRDSRPRHRYSSRSPDANRRRGRDAPRGGRDNHRRDDRAERQRGKQREEPQRERSLSPFSKRLALTKSMK